MAQHTGHTGPLKTIPAYIAAAPAQARPHLRAIYATLKKTVPQAEEALRWRSPVFIEKRILFAFAGFRDHLNFMPTPPVLKAFKKELTAYKTGVGSVSFRYDEPLPKALIARMARLRVKELREKDAKWMG